jgi:hypothetical protein
MVDHWVVEPQAQLIVGKTTLDKQNDGISDVTDADTSVTARLGVRLRGEYSVSGAFRAVCAGERLAHQRWRK